MSGRRLMNCSNCRQRHYAPSGAKCPYQPGEKLPQEVLPLSDSESDSEIGADEQAPSKQLPETGLLSELEFEFPSGQQDPQVPSTSQTPDPEPITLQQFADSTAGRMQLLENERAQLSQTQATLQAQQQTLQASVDAIRLHLLAQPLKPNPDVRRKNATKTNNADNGSTQQNLQTNDRMNQGLNAAQNQQEPVLLTPNTQTTRGLPFPGPLQQTPPTQIRHDQAGHALGLQQTQPPQQPQTNATQLGASLWDTIINQPQGSQFNTPQINGNSTLAQLRTDAQLMQQAARVIANNTQENNDNGKAPKSGLKRDNAEQVCRVIPWPHEHVLRNLSKPPTYESLALSEFAAGYMHILANLPNVPTQLVDMTNYLAELFDDVTDTDWPTARFAHRVVLQAIENGRVDFNFTSEVRQLRSMALNRAARRQLTTASTQSQNAPSSSKNKQWNNTNNNGANNNRRACQAFQKGECSHNKSHQSPQGYVFHACAYCLATVQRTYNHTENDCRRKASNPKDTKSDEPGTDNQ